MIRLYKRGSVYHVDSVSTRGRVRASLGTSDKTTAFKLRSRLEVATVEGRQSAGWSELRNTLPARTYKKFAGPTEMSWEGLVRVFWSDCKRKRLAASTVKRYQTSVDKFTKYLEDNEIDLSDITPFAIEGFEGTYQDSGCLRSVFGLAVRHGIMRRNPIEQNSKPATVRDTKPYTADELQRIRENCPPEDLLTFMLFRWTGMRGSDVADLRWSDVHFLDKEIRRKAIKNGVELQIPLQTGLAQQLSGKSHIGNVLLYENKSVDRAFLGRRMHLIYNRAGVSGGHNHRFRATFAVDLLLKGATVFEVAKALGDETRTVEKHYLKYVPNVRNRLKGLLEDTTKGIE